MLILTVNPGDQIVIHTPMGDVQMFVGSKADRRRIGIDAPAEFTIVRRRGPDRLGSPQTEPPATDTPTTGG